MSIEGVQEGRGYPDLSGSTNKKNLICFVCLPNWYNNDSFAALMWGIQKFVVIYRQSCEN